ncbi:MAG: tetratricopeptide repeat protein [Verrucomicrobia bacterium]|nr:tetratricopeptide repeat protein [Verrucomicrobiota bacterium]
MESIRPRGREFVIGLLLAAVTLAAYWPARNFDFVDYDDQDYVKDNAFVRSGLNKTSVEWAFQQSHSGNWHPLTWASLMFDCQFFGEKKNPADRLFNVQAGPMHVHNALLHAANAALFFWVLRRMTGAVWASAFAAALFAWHPLRVESVAWVTERKDVLSTLFWLLTMGAWLRYTERRSAWRYGLALLMFALGLMSKSMLVTLPCVLVLLDFWPLKRWPAKVPPPPPPKSKKKNALPPAPVAEAPTGVPWKWLVLEKIPFFALIVAVSVWTLHTQRSGGAMTFGDSLPMKHRLLNGLVAYAEYLRKFFWPDDLAVFYPHPGQWPAARIAVAATVLVLISALAVWQRRARPHLLLGWLWYLGTLVPVIGIIQVGGQAWADRYTYVPMLGIVVALAWELAIWVQRLRVPTGVIGVLAAIALAACLAATVAQLRHWQNTFSLFSHALDVTKNNHRAHKGVADVYRDEGKNVEADRHYEEAIRIKPTFLGARVNYGMALVNQKKFDAAAFQFRVAVQINPNNPEAHNNLAAVLEMTGKHPEAIQEYRKAIELRPNYPTAINNLNKLLARQPKSAAKP